MYFVLFVTVIVSFFLAIWFAGYVYITDFSVSTKKITDFKNLKKILIVFPHADDEALSCAGLLSDATDKGIDVDWLLLTKGEKGNDGRFTEEELKTVRVEEARRAAKILGIKNLIQKGYPDNNLPECKSKIITEIRQTMISTKPDVVITYDLSGLYGHPDHIVVSEIVTEMIRKEFPLMKLWYISNPKKLLAAIPLPEHMAKDTTFKTRRVNPTMKIPVTLLDLLKKIKLVYVYDSQKKPFFNRYPMKLIPLWFCASLTVNEYYHEVK